MKKTKFRATFKSIKYRKKRI